MLTALIGALGAATAAALDRRARRAAAIDRAHALASPRRRRLPHPVRIPLGRALRAADLDLTPEAALRAWAIAAGAAALAGWALAPTVAVGAAVAVLVGGPVWLGHARHRADARVAAALPALAERVASHLRSGGTVRSALAAAATAPGPLAADVAAVLQRVRWGSSLDAALAAWSDERQLPGVRATAGALAMADSLGGAAAGALDGLAASRRDALAVAAEARSLATQARLSAWVVGAAPAAYVAFTAVVDPASVGVLVTTTVGRVCLVAGLGLEMAAALWMRRILRGPR